MVTAMLYTLYIVLTINAAPVAFDLEHYATLDACIADARAIRVTLPHANVSCFDDALFTTTRP